MSKDIWLPPYRCTENDSLIFLGPWPNLRPDTADMKIYDGVEDVTSTVAPTGSNSISGNVATYKKISVLTANKVYVINFLVSTVDGQTYTMKMELHVEAGYEKQA